MIVPPRARVCLRTALAVAAAGLVAVSPVPAQFRGGVALVEVYVTLTDAAGRPVRGLSADDFRVTEEDRPQAIAAFAEGDVPLGVAIAIDHSFSVSARQLAAAVGAAERFLAALQHGDEVMVLGIGSQTEVLTPLTTDRGRTVAALRRLASWGTTPLYDAVVNAVTNIDAAAGRRALVLITDGVERYSATPPAAMIEQTRRRNVLVYPVVLARAAPGALSDVASVTGGRLITVPDAEHLPARLEQIATELRAQYMLGYSSDAPPPGAPEWRRIRVSVNRPGVTVRAREGYLAR